MSNADPNSSKVLGGMASTISPGVMQRHICEGRARTLSPMLGSYCEFADHWWVVDPDAKDWLRIEDPLLIEKLSGHRRRVD